MSEIVISEVLANADVHRLVDLRPGLLRLHKTLLDMERNRRGPDQLDHLSSPTFYGI
jgi:hypothetical protein